MPAGKTPGKVAWEAYISTLVETPDRPARGGYSSPAWEAAAQAVRMQQEAELLSRESILDYDAALEAIVQVRDIRKVLASYGSNHAKVMGEWVYMDANEVIEEIEDLLASPAPGESKDGR